MESYRVDYEKAERLLTCVRPRIMFINGVFGTGKSHIAEVFKKYGYNVISLDRIYERINSDIDKIPTIGIRKAVVSEVRAHLMRFEGTIPIVVEGFIRDPTLVSDIFSDQYDIFTYVYMYPNNPKRYKERIIHSMKEHEWKLSNVPYGIPPDLLNDDELEELRTSGRGANTAIRKLVDINKKIYKEHLEEFDNVVITVLN